MLLKRVHIHHFHCMTYLPVITLNELNAPLGHISAYNPPFLNFKLLSSYLLCLQKRVLEPKSCMTFPSNPYAYGLYLCNVTSIHSKAATDSVFPSRFNMLLF